MVGRMNTEPSDHAGASVGWSGRKPPSNFHALKHEWPMNRPSARELLKNAIKERMRCDTIGADMPLRAWSTSLIVTGKDRRKLAEMSFEFLARVDSVYLVTRVIGGRLSNMVEAAALPPEARHSLAVGLYFKSTLAEKSPRFTSERGGAESFSSRTDLPQLAEKLVSRAVEHYAPNIDTILSMTPRLPELITHEAPFFSFPLAALAILEHLGLDDTFSRIEGTREASALSPKESLLDVRSIVRASWERIVRAGGESNE
jgi:hypothetical protein